MDIANYCIRNKISTFALTLLVVVAGYISYNSLGRLEDPEFTLKTALVVTTYPGATAEQVELEVTEVIERAVQQLGQLDSVESQSQQGRSTVTVNVKDKYNKDSLPQVWDELRRKVNDAQEELPPGAGTSMVVDDFGDVYGIFFAITGDGYSMKELKDYAEFLQRELLLCDDVAKITLSGIQSEVIYVEMAREKMARFGISKQAIYDTLKSKNLISDAGNIRVADEYLQLLPTGEFDSVEDFGNLMIGSYGAGSDGQTQLISLRDVATIKRGYVDPPAPSMRVDGKPAIGLAISTVAGGNVVTMGDSVMTRLDELLPLKPLGIELHRISIQSEAVTAAINGFVSSLLQAIVIVIVVLMLFMGLRSGVLIGVVLLITIMGTFIFMKQQGVMLERISLGALIIALGMLVDNAIVITDGILVRIQNGEDRVKAAGIVVKQNQMPLLGATVIAILAFAAIGTSNDSTGEFCGSLYKVLLISLLFSWVTAITITPLFCVMFLKANKGDKQVDPYNSRFYRAYKWSLQIAIRRRWATVLVMVALLFLSIYGFGYVKNSFFPDSTRPQFLVDFWLPEGMHIEQTERVAKQVEEYLTNKEGVSSVATFIAQGAPRFLLTYSAEKTNTAFAHFLVSVDDYRVINDLLPEVQRELEENFSQAIPIAYRFALGPGEATKIQVRFSGPDWRVLRELAVQATKIMHDDGGMIGVQTDWRDLVKTINPQIDEVAARNQGIDRPMIAAALKEAFDGSNVGLYREGNDLIPIKSRAPFDERNGVAQIQNLLIWSPVVGGMIPMSQLVNNVEIGFENSVIKRRDRIRTITAKCNPREGLPSVGIGRIMDQINAIEIPPGYKLEWGGEVESSSDAQAALFGKIPLFVALMILIVILLFNSLRLPTIIWLCVPLAIIGVTAGLLFTGQPFGFMALLGLLSLSGMLIKNAIVLIDQINLEIKEGKEPYHAVLDSGVSRMRPVMMAAATTVLGMIPLLLDAFFVSMAVTIMAGLTFASILTLVFVPVLYTIFFKIPSPTKE